MRSQGGLGGAGRCATAQRRRAKLGRARRAIDRAARFRAVSRALRTLVALDAPSLLQAAAPLCLSAPRGRQRVAAPCARGVPHLAFERLFSRRSYGRQQPTAVRVVVAMDMRMPSSAHAGPWAWGCDCAPLDPGRERLQLQLQRGIYRVMTHDQSSARVESRGMRMSHHWCAARATCSRGAAARLCPACTVYVYVRVYAYIYNPWPWPADVGQPYALTTCTRAVHMRDTFSNDSTRAKARPLRSTFSQHHCFKPTRHSHETWSFTIQSHGWRRVGTPAMPNS